MPVQFAIVFEGAEHLFSMLLLSPKNQKIYDTSYSLFDAKTKFTGIKEAF
jgi:hypothetical protein